MTSAAPGKDISAVEVTNVSKHGFWLLLGERDWPDLDVDLAVESVFHPEQYPPASRR